MCAFMRAPLPQILLFSALIGHMYTTCMLHVRYMFAVNYIHINPMINDNYLKLPGHANSPASYICVATSIPMSEISILDKQAPMPDEIIASYAY